MLLLLSAAAFVVSSADDEMDAETGEDADAGEDANAGDGNEDYIYENIKAAENDGLHDFELCPETHPRAFGSGNKCCDNSTNWSRHDCEGEALDCSSPPCEDFSSNCVDAFALFKDRGVIAIGIAFYTDYKLLWSNRPIYQSNETCIWWQRPNRHWLIGSCEDVGADNGSAYLQQDFDCPDQHGGLWRRQDTDEEIEDLEWLDTRLWYKSFCDRCASRGVRTTYTSGAVGVNFIRQDRHYEQQRRPRFIRGQLAYRYG